MSHIPGYDILCHCGDSVTCIFLMQLYLDA
jgi:hypothetical protein